MFPAYQTWLLVLGISAQNGSEQSAEPGKVTADSCSAGIADLMSFSSACGATAGQRPVLGEGEHAALGAQRCKSSCVCKGANPPRCAKVQMKTVLAFRSRL